MEKQEILELVRQYSQDTDIYASESGIYKVTGAEFTPEDIVEVVDAALDSWFTEGVRARRFRREISRFTKARHCILVNSGSSANLLAVTAIKDLFGDKDGHYVITCSTAFPTTVAPLIQNGYRLAFVNIDPETLCYDEDRIVELLARPDVRGVFLAHTLGIPFDEKRIAKACIESNKWLLSDCCDAFGSTVDGSHVGLWGEAGTLSFFPAHHITTGEGGAVFTDNAELFRLMQQYANWGRDCWCEPGKSNTCNKRFEHEFPRLPKGYDHKYTFTKIGYNLKMTELQAALGLSQIRRLPSYVDKRRENYNKIYSIMKKHDGLYWDIIPLDDGTSPFGFYILANNETTRKELVQMLENNNIQTRPLFAGNITRHPMMRGHVPLSHSKGSDEIMERGFWIGCWPGVTQDNLAQLEKVLDEFAYG